MKRWAIWFAVPVVLLTMGQLVDESSMLVPLASSVLLVWVIVTPPAIFIALIKWLVWGRPPKTGQTSIVPGK